MSGYHNNSIFWVEVQKIGPNPFQPRRDFEPKALEDLADSIRQYGVLQPLVVTRKETVRPDNNGMDVHYELIAGERRLRASRLAGLQQVPVIIRKETDDKVKLELAIIENLQREDLNPIDRALAFEQLYKQFGLTHVEIGKKMGKSRVYVSNSLRLLSLPEEIKKGLIERRISEGHTRPLLMLIDRPEQQTTLYKEIMVKRLSVRDAEKVARKIAQDKVRKKEFIVDPKIREFEKKLSENLGTRVHIEPKEKGGQITIDYFTTKDLEAILASMKKIERQETMMDTYLQNNQDTKNEIQATTGFSFHENKNGESKKVDFNFLENTNTEILIRDNFTRKETTSNKGTQMELNDISTSNINVENQEISKENTKTLSESENVISLEGKDIESESRTQFEEDTSNSFEKLPNENTHKSYITPAAQYQARHIRDEVLQNSPAITESIQNQSSNNYQSQEITHKNTTGTSPITAIHNQHYTQPPHQQYTAQQTQHPNGGPSYSYDQQVYNQPPVMPKKQGFFGKLFG